VLNRKRNRTPLSKYRPDKLLIGDFTLVVELYTSIGHWDAAKKQATGVSGLAWVNFDCGGLPSLSIQPYLPEGFIQIKNYLEVVSTVTNPETEISFAEAHKIQPDIQIGKTIELELTVTPDELQNVVLAEKGLIDKLRIREGKGGILVWFENVTIGKIVRSKNTGRITEGKASYPTPTPVPKIIKLSIDGFTILIDSLTLTTKNATANVTLQLPRTIASVDTCNPATLKVGRTSITPKCEIYQEKPRSGFGPWIIGDTGMVLSGSGYIVDLSLTKSPPLKELAWRGLVLMSGMASGSTLIPEDSNTGYLAGKYAFSDATVTKTGFDGYFRLSEQFKYQTVHPLGYIVSIDDGGLTLSGSKIISGQLGPGLISLPCTAICKEIPSSTITAHFTSLTVQNDLDISGEVSFDAGLISAWGELNHTGDEIIAWTIEGKKGYLYLPAGPVPSFSPDTSTGFLDLSFDPTPGGAIAQLEALGIPGIVIYDMKNLKVYSLDRPNGTANPIEIIKTYGWLRVGSRGLDGEIETFEASSLEELGNDRRYGYVGGKPFDATIFPYNKRITIVQYIDSAVYDSRIDGFLKIPEPCNIDGLEFSDMEFTSTAQLVGGDVILPVGGVSLDYWRLNLVPTGDPEQAGVVSVRTGRIVFTAAGISEPVHFAQPFALTWGEMLADGNLGELFFDYNSYGQRFDGLPYSPHHIMLSKWVSGATDGYLATCGTIHINFFGPAFVNIHDARYDASSAAPYLGRYVTVPKQGEASCKPTDLRLYGEWNAVDTKALAIFDFPDIKMDYNKNAQDGFIGTGASTISFFTGGNLDATIEVHRDATDIGMTSTTTRDVDIGLFAQLGGMSGISACARIEGPLLQRISICGYLEKTVATGISILAPKAGFMIEAGITVTPNSFDFNAAGDMLFSVAGSAVDVSASVHLARNYARSSSEGEIIGRIDCNTIMMGLEGEGQVTWYVDPLTQYLQGRLKMTICSWTGGVGFEGGLFIGHQVHKSKAWVLKSGNEHFSISDSMLPETLTGLYGYGQISFAIQLYIIGGGIELYLGLGAFSLNPPGVNSLWPTTWSSVPNLGLPYVLGRGGIHVYGEILGGLVSASAWANLALLGPSPLYFEGKVGLEGCVLWVICASVELTAGLGSDGFYIY